MEKCEQCRFYKHGAPAGECRINPPQIIGHGDVRSTLWPSVNRDGWCGQFTFPEKAHQFKLGPPQTKDKPNG